MAQEAPALDAEQARRLLDAAAGRRVLVVGDGMLDHYIVGDVERISPEAPVPVVRVSHERHALGGAANVAAGLVALGAEGRLACVVGDDEAAARFRELLTVHGIPDTELVTDPGRPTTRKSRILARHHQMLRVDREDAGSLGGAVARRLEARALAELASADALILQDYDKGVITPSLARALLDAAREGSVPTVVDPKLRHFFDVPGATVLKPNGRELAAALGVERPPRDESSLRPLLDRLGCEHLLLTLGEEGMLLVSRDGTGTERIPSRAREVYDVTGAGDTVVAVLGAALAGGAGVPAAARLANLAAGLEVSRLGAVPVSRSEILEEFD